jgi:hypothetical protein
MKKVTFISLVSTQLFTVTVDPDLCKPDEETWAM